VTARSFWRVLVIALIAANGAVWAWWQGWLAPLVAAPGAEQRDPDRLARQLRPETVLLRAEPVPVQGGAKTVPPAAAPPAASPAVSPAASSATSAGTCLEAGPFGDNTLPAVERELAAAGVAAAGFRMVDGPPLSWWIYMGRYPSDSAAQGKSDELRKIGIEHDTVRSPADLRPGLALGRFTDREHAQAALGRLSDRGIRTARVVEVADAPRTRRVQVATNDAALASRLQALRSNTVPALVFAACKNAAPASAPR
jgi:hypothetical protein